MKINTYIDTWVVELLNSNKCSSVDELSLEAINDEIEDAKATYSNEKLWAMGATTIEEADMHIYNMEELSDYLDFLLDLKNERS